MKHRRVLFRWPGGRQWVGRHNPPVESCVRVVLRRLKFLTAPRHLNQSFFKIRRNSCLMPVLGRNSGSPAGFRLLLMRSIKVRGWRGGSPAPPLHPPHPRRCGNNDEWASLMLFICLLFTRQSWKMRGQRQNSAVFGAWLPEGFTRASQHRGHTTDLLGAALAFAFFFFYSAFHQVV